MPHRVIAFVLSLLLLLGSGPVSAQGGGVAAGESDVAVRLTERIQDLELDPEITTATVDLAQDTASVPVGHGPLPDERPGPVELESVSEPPGLPPADGLRTGSLMVAAPPVATPEPGFNPPFLAGPLRPPCRGTHPAA